MLRGAGKPPAPPNLIPAQPYQSAPAWNDPSANLKGGPIDSYVPPVLNSRQITGAALGKGVSPDLSNYGSGWLSLKNSPTDANNVAGAENAYLNYAAPGEQQVLSNAVANNMGGSSYLAQTLGANHANNQLGAWNAGINQRNSDFQNQLAAYGALYNGPIGLTQSQNLADVQRGLGVAGLQQNGGIAQNQYNLQNTQGANAYNLGVNQIGNNFGLGRYGTQMQGFGIQTGANTQRGIGNQNFGANLFQSAVGSKGLF